MPALTTAAQHYQNAVQYFQANSYHLALKEIDAAILAGPVHKNMYFLKSDILSTYHRVIYKGEDVPTMLMDPKLLPLLVETSKKAVELDPQNEKAKSLYQEYVRILNQEMAILNAHRNK